MTLHGRCARSTSGPEFARLRAALHPLDAAPHGPAWNIEELRDSVVGEPPQPAAVLVGLRPTHSGLQVLLTRRHTELRQHPGQVSFPGGRIEAGDRDAWAAALREAGEEVGLLHADAEPLGYLDPLLTISGFRVQPVVAVLQPDFVARPYRVEVAGVFEVPLAFLLDPANLGSVAVEHAGRPRRVLEFHYGGERIWGVTASILLNLRERLAGGQCVPP